MNSNESGAAAEYLAAARFLSMGYKVWWPGDQSSSADLLIEKDHDFLRVQAKRATWVRKTGSAHEYLRVKTVSNHKGYTKAYKYGDYDLLAAVDGQRLWIIPYEETRRFKSAIYLDKRGGTARNRAAFDSDHWLAPQP